MVVQFGNRMVSGGSKNGFREWFKTTIVGIIFVGHELKSAGIPVKKRKTRKSVCVDSQYSTQRQIQAGQAGKQYFWSANWETAAKRRG